MMPCIFLGQWGSRPQGHLFLGIPRDSTAESDLPGALGLVLIFLHFFPKECQKSHLLRKECKPTWDDHLSTCLFQTVHFSPQVLPFTSDHLSTCLFQTVHFSSQVLPFTILSTSHLHFSPVHIPTFHDYVFNILGSPLKLGTVNN